MIIKSINFFLKTNNEDEFYQKLLELKFSALNDEFTYTYKQIDISVKKNNFSLVEPMFTLTFSFNNYNYYSFAEYVSISQKLFKHFDTSVLIETHGEIQSTMHPNNVLKTLQKKKFKKPYEDVNSFVLDDVKNSNQIVLSHTEEKDNMHNYSCFISGNTISVSLINSYFKAFTSYLRQ